MLVEGNAIVQFQTCFSRNHVFKSGCFLENYSTHLFHLLLRRMLIVFPEDYTTKKYIFFQSRKTEKNGEKITLFAILSKRRLKLTVGSAPKNLLIIYNLETQFDSDAYKQRKMIAYLKFIARSFKYPSSPSSRVLFIFFPDKN